MFRNKLSFWRRRGIVSLEQLSERERRELAQAHRGEVIPGSGELVEPRDFHSHTGKEDPDETVGD